MDYLQGHLAEAYFHDRARSEAEDEGSRTDWLQSIYAVGGDREPMQTGVASVKFVEVVDQAWLEIPGDFSRVVSLVVAVAWSHRQARARARRAAGEDEPSWPDPETRAQF